MKLKFTVLKIFLLIPIIGLAQELNNVKFTSKNQYLINKSDSKVIDEQSYDINFSIVDGEVILEEYGRVDYYKILQTKQISEKEWNLILEEDQFLKINEKNNLYGFDSRNTAFLLCFGFCYRGRRQRVLSENRSYK